MPGTTMTEEQPLFECPDCGREWESESDSDECCAIVCSICGSRHDSDDAAYECCRFQCGNCGDWHDYESDADSCCIYSCDQCGSQYDYHVDADNCCRRGGNGDYPVLPDVEHYRMDVPSIEGRPGRLCSIEQELAEGGRAVARMMRDYGFSDYSEIRNYSFDPPARTVAVKDDASIPSEGGEVVYSRFMLSNEDEAIRLSEALSRVRQLRNAGTVRSSTACGVHIHIAARDEDGNVLSPVAMAALHELFGYAEDMLFSLAACGWDRHRQMPGESGYCKVIPKVTDGPNSPQKVARLMRRDRYFALNFQRLLNAANACSCGAARVGDWTECECGVFDTATVEWRIFNTSTKPETIHAWLLLSHALTALATRHPLGSLESNEYGSSSPQEKGAVLRWLLAEAPLTDGEREVIRAAARRSPGIRL